VTDKRVAVVTGGGSGLGLAICQHLARQGNRVAVLDLNLAAAEAAAADIVAEGGEALAVAVDVADRPSVDAAMAKVRRDLGPIAILVTSAAIAGFTRLNRSLSTSGTARWLSTLPARSIARSRQSPTW
jgi:2-hydroxycyclohexanecarboxyl-CoA dehydrogenase